jgi:hypothetical protein
MLRFTAEDRCPPYEASRLGLPLSCHRSKSSIITRPVKTILLIPGAATFSRASQMDCAF